jgi:uncharacterized protein (DUF885 family)
MRLSIGFPAAVLFASFVSVGSFCGAQQAVADRVAAQNALFEEQYQADLKVAPERATAVGDYRYNDRLGERSLAAIAERHEMDRRYLERLRGIATMGFAEQDLLSHDLMVRMLEQRDADYKLKDYEPDGWAAYGAGRFAAGGAAGYGEAL